MGILIIVIANLIFICLIYGIDGVLKEHSKRTVKLGIFRFFILHYSQRTEKVLSCKRRRIYSVDNENKESISLLALCLQIVCICYSVAVITCDIISLTKNNLISTYWTTDLGLSVTVLSFIYFLSALFLFVLTYILESIETRKKSRDNLKLYPELSETDENQYNNFIQKHVETATSFFIECDGEKFKLKPYNSDKWLIVETSSQRILNVDKLDKIFVNVAIDDITLKQRWSQIRIID